MKLTNAQLSILAAAADNDGTLPLTSPTNLIGAAFAKVKQSLETRGLLKRSRRGYLLTPAGYAAIGREPASKGDVQPTRRNAEPGADAPRRTRENSKQAQVIAMLKRDEGATIAQVMEATDWLPHTVRGFFSGALRKKLGLDVIAEKADDGERVYRIA